MYTNETQIYYSHEIHKRHEDFNDDHDDDYDVGKSLSAASQLVKGQ